MPKRSKAELDILDHHSSWTLRDTHPRREGDRKPTRHIRAERPSVGGTRKMGRGSTNPQLRGRTAL